VITHNSTNVKNSEQWPLTSKSFCHVLSNLIDISSVLWRIWSLLLISFHRLAVAKNCMGSWVGMTKIRLLYWLKCTYGCFKICINIFYCQIYTIWLNTKFTTYIKQSLTCMECGTFYTRYSLWPSYSLSVLCADNPNRESIRYHLPGIRNYQ